MSFIQIGKYTLNRNVIKSVSIEKEYYILNIMESIY